MLPRGRDLWFVARFCEYPTLREGWAISGITYFGRKRSRYKGSSGKCSFISEGNILSPYILRLCTHSTLLLQQSFRLIGRKLSSYLGSLRFASKFCRRQMLHNTWRCARCGAYYDQHIHIYTHIYGNVLTLFPTIVLHSGEDICACSIYLTMRRNSSCVLSSRAI